MTVVSARSIRKALIASLFFALSVFAQQPGRSFDPESMLERQLSEMKSKLDLTAGQEQKVRPILKDSIDRMIELRSKSREESGGPPSSGLREEMSKLRQQTRKQLGEVLTKEQMGKYDKMMQERRERMGGGFRGRRNN